MSIGCGGTGIVRDTKTYIYGDGNIAYTVKLVELTDECIERIAEAVVRKLKVDEVTE